MVSPKPMVSPRPIVSPRPTVSSVPMILPALLATACAVLIGGCGGAARQDAGEPDTTYTVAITRATFPAEQSIVAPATMTIAVRNTSATTMPNVSVTVDSFDYTSDYPGLASRTKPIWIVEQGPGTTPRALVATQTISPPGGGETAYVNTWALGPLAAGHTRTFTWHVTPIRAGAYTVHYLVAAGLSGRSHALLADGSTPRGDFDVTIAPRPPSRHINPSTGQIAPGRYPPPPYPTPSP